MRAAVTSGSTAGILAAEGPAREATVIDLRESIAPALHGSVAAVRALADAERVLVLEETEVIAYSGASTPGSRRDAAFVPLGVSSEDDTARATP